MKKRQSNFELLRIICMFLIVAGHVTWQTKFSYDELNLVHQYLFKVYGWVEN